MGGYKNGIYSPGQASVLFNYWPEDAEWFILGGPAVGNEGQTVHARYPKLNYIAFEPNPYMLKAQLEMKVPFPGPIYKVGLYNTDCVMDLVVPGPRRDISSSVCREFDGDSSSYERISVEVYTLDTLSKFYGPFINVVLWIDIEHAELKALQGATGLLETGQILMVNVEVMHPDMLVPIEELLNSYGLRKVKVWNTGTMPHMSDVVFKKL